MLGKMNWSGLSNYLVKPSDMELFQTYMTDNLKRSVLDKFTTGIINGGKITVLSGLTVRISAGSALMSNGVLTEWPQTDITLDAANATNPRLDRIELVVANVNNTTVLDEANLNKTLDIIYSPTISKVTGTPAASPSLPAQTLNSISIGYVQVPATAVALISGNIFQNPNNGYNKSAYVLGNSNGYIRFNEFTSQMELSADTLTWEQIQTSAFQKLTAIIANNQSSAADVTSFLLDTSKGTGYRVAVNISRETSTTKLRAYGVIDFEFDPTTSTWSFVPQLIGDADLCGLALSVALVSGSVSKLQYTSDNMSGTGYVGTMKFSVKDIL